MHTNSAPAAFRLGTLYSLVLFLFFVLSDVAAQSNSVRVDFWKKTTVDTQMQPVRTAPLPRIFQTYHLAGENLKTALSDAPARFSGVTSETFVALPQADGTTLDFRVYDSPVLAKKLQDNYPDLASFHLQGLENESVTARLSFTSQGVYALVLHPENGLTYIEPYGKNFPDLSVVYTPQDLGTAAQQAEFSCNSTSEKSNENASAKSADSVIPDCFLRKYRLAVSATGEYVQWHGGTKAAATEKIMLLVAHSNLVYEREAGITFELAENNDEIVFLNPATDPFSGSDKFALLSENQAVTDVFIGTENYDLGIVVGIFGGGVAQLNSVCHATKAQASAGSTFAPEGYTLEATFMHELAHQFGATHSFNNSCNNNRDLVTAFETGSGSSLMSYAGACAPSVTYPRDFYFHSKNLAQIIDFQQNDPEADCAEIIVTGNLAPLADAGQDKILPVGVPFELTGSSNNPDGDAQNYSWEQIDNFPAAAPPEPTAVTGPAFRSFTAKSSPTRSFPQTDCLLGTPQTDCEWEVIPDFSRTMKFNFTAYDVRDDAGCWSSDELDLEFTSTVGTFALTSPNGGEAFSPAQIIEATWAIGETDIAPIAATSVDISLSTDGGHTFPYLLATEIPNTGSATLTLPDVLSETCRLKIKGHDHYFFDLSDADFRIADLTNFALLPTVAEQSFCGTAPSSVTFTIEVTADPEFTGQITFPAADNAGSPSVSFTPGAVTPPAVVEMTVSGIDNAPEQTFTVNAAADGISRSTQLTVRIHDNQPAVPQVISPAANALQADLQTTLTWSETANTEYYELQLFTAADFSAPFFTENTHLTSLALPPLQAMTIYYAKVRSVNSCAAGEWSALSAFRTADRICTTHQSVNTPRALAANDFDDAFGRVEFAEDFPISSVRVKNLNIEHTHLGDLSGTLVAPDGSIFSLFYRPGYEGAGTYGCTGDDMTVDFYDAAAADNEAMRAMCQPLPQIGITGAFQPAQSFQPLVGTSSAGTWLVNINDLSPTDGGTLQEVSLELCRDDVQPTNNLLISLLPLNLNQYETQNIGANLLNANDPNAYFRLLSLPQRGTLLLDEIPLTAGAIFTLTQVQNGALQYAHGGTIDPQDSFYLQAENAAGEWSGLREFFVNITLSAPFPTATVSQNVSCHGAADGALTVGAVFGTPPYAYSLDGENFQNDAAFTNLAAGIYEVYVSDAAGQIVQGESVQIVNPEPLTVTTTADFQSINVQANGGTGSYAYSLDGENFQTENTFQTGADGFYTVTLQDENGCTTAAEILVNNLTAQLNLAQALNCHSDENATLTVQTTNGIPPFQYRINDGDLQSENIFTDLPADNYTAEIQDASGTIFTTETINIEAPELLTATTEITGYTVEILSDNPDVPLLYSIDGADFSPENTFFGAPQTSYTITVQNAAGCQTQTTAQIILLPPALTETATETSDCHGDNTATITLTGAQGLLPYTYSLDGENYQAENVFTDLAAGTYSATVRDAGGYETAATVIEITEPTELTLTAASQAENIVLTGVGGTGDLEFSINNAPWQSEPIFYDLVGGTYQIGLRDANGCTVFTDYQHQGSALSVQTFSEAFNSCQSEIPLQVSVCVNGGVPPFTLLSFPTPTGIETLTESDCHTEFLLTYTPETEGTVTVQTTDADGTQFTNVVTLDIAETMEVNLVQNDNNLSVFGIAGTPPFTYSLDGENYQSSGYFTDLENGEYILYGTDAAGCTVAVDFTVDVMSSNENPTAGGAFKLYPNPTSEVLYLEIPRDIFRPVTVTIYDAAGRLVLTKNAAAGVDKLTLATVDLAAGFYGVRVQAAGAVWTERVVVLR